MSFFTPSVVFFNMLFACTQALQSEHGISANGIGNLTFSDNAVGASPSVVMQVGGVTGLSESGRVAVNVSASGTDACLSFSLSLRSSNLEASDALKTVEAVVNDCSVGGTVCLRT